MLQKEDWTGRRSLSGGSRNWQTKSGRRHYSCVVVMTVAVDHLKLYARSRAPFAFTRWTWVYLPHNFRTQRLLKRLEELYAPPNFSDHECRVPDVSTATSAIRLELHGHGVHFALDHCTTQLSVPRFREAAALSYNLFRIVLV